ncbi:phosphotransferase family protein [Streptomyces xiangluensis]|uniref:Phosphotransferase family protein n=1 Tax=Streptomyces xiangluensis TaxID=2665720 RepID=A0ABV8YX43_9ACTN
MTTSADTTSPPGLELAALSRWFDVQVPGCQGPLTATVLHGGRSNLTYRVTDGHTSWVVRRPPLGGLTPSAHDVGREFRVMSALRDSGVAVPEALAHCTDEEVIGAPFTVVSYVEGRVLRSRTDTAGLTPYELRRCADGLVEQLVRVHAVPYPEAGLTGLGRPQGYLRRQIDRWRAQWDLVATRPLPELLRLHRALEEVVPSESGASVVHGDFRVDNTILDPDDLGRVRAVVDWELSTLGDPLADLGTFLAYRDPAVDALLDSPAATDPGFPGQPELAEQYALLSGRDITLLPFYQALAYFKIAVIAEGVHARHLQGVTVGEGFAGACSSVPELVWAGLAFLGRRG